MSSSQRSVFCVGGVYFPSTYLPIEQSSTRQPSSSLHVKLVSILLTSHLVGIPSSVKFVLTFPLNV
ncbi:hypothetical protein K443DRAFT_367539 [Laccaria amethystina LaAM-08-1]|uniref:Uncharacterized protein n=1 Tax=Laccaria amethystina LaAM-08-1 TaxID=1095629 RepID=A0A0C9WZG5_9AGAR|nr:hypothetical protein K443DRAFT_367539 [Laccaria amethystina LaAM-08-1]